MRPSEDGYELMRAIANGNDEAMMAFYDTYFGIVAGFCRTMIDDRSTADEVIQDVFWQVWRQAGQYDPGRAKISTWLMTIARSRVIDALRRMKRQDWQVSADQEGLIESEASSAAGGDVEAEVAARLERHRIRQALQDLPPPQRDAVYRIHFEGRTAKEVAEHEAVPVGTIKTRLRLGLEKLRKVLEVQADDA